MLEGPEHSQWCREGYCSLTCFEQSEVLARQTCTGEPDVQADDLKNASEEALHDSGGGGLTEFQPTRTFRFQRIWLIAAGCVGFLIDLVIPVWTFAAITAITFGLMAKRQRRNPWGWAVLAAAVFFLVAGVADTGAILLFAFLAGKVLPSDLIEGLRGIVDSVSMTLAPAMMNLLLFGAFVALWRVILRRIGPPPASSSGQRLPTAVRVFSWVLIVTSVVTLLSIAVANLLTQEEHVAGLEEYGPPGLFRNVFGWAGLSVMLIAGRFMLKGANWARWLYVIWGAVSIALCLVTFYGPILLLVPGLIFYAIFVGLLFQSESTAFFKKGDGGLR